jgi:hypothetical protein
VAVFDGVAALLAFIGQLFQRPRFIDCFVRGWRSGDRPLPLVFLIRKPDSEQLLKELCAHFDQATQRQVPHVWVDVAEEGRSATEKPVDAHANADRSAPPLPILMKLCEELESDRFGFGRRQRLSCYKLTAWLTCQLLDNSVGSDPRRDLARRLASRRGGRSMADAPLSTVIQNMPGPASKVTLSLFSAFWPVLRFWLWASGRVPGFGRESRWFMRQRYMAPRLSADFLGFADRLTREPRKKEDVEQVNKLLVHAFLEDLRCAYRRRPWRLHPWRHTAYTTVIAR